MICPKCGAELKEEARFCSKCGSQIVDVNNNQENADITATISLEKEKPQVVTESAIVPPKDYSFKDYVEYAIKCYGRLVSELEKPIEERYSASADATEDKEASLIVKCIIGCLLFDLLFLGISILKIILAIVIGSIMGKILYAVLPKEQTKPQEIDAEEERHRSFENTVLKSLEDEVTAYTLEQCGIDKAYSLFTLVNDRILAYQNSARTYLIYMMMREKTDSWTLEEYRKMISKVCKNWFMQNYLAEKEQEQRFYDEVEGVDQKFGMYQPNRYSKELVDKISKMCSVMEKPLRIRSENRSPKAIPTFSINENDYFECVEVLNEFSQIKVLLSEEQTKIEAENKKISEKISEIKLKLNHLKKNISNYLYFSTRFQELLAEIESVVSINLQKMNIFGEELSQQIEKAERDFTELEALYEKEHMKAKELYERQTSLASELTQKLEGLLADWNSLRDSVTHVLYYSKDFQNLFYQFESFLLNHSVRYQEITYQLKTLSRLSSEQCENINQELSALLNEVDSKFEKLKEMYEAEHFEAERLYEQQEILASELSIKLEKVSHEYNDVKYSSKVEEMIRKIRKLISAYEKGPGLLKKDEIESEIEALAKLKRRERDNPIRGVNVAGDDLQVGSVIEFGTFNGKPIKWIVLRKTNDFWLLLSQKTLAEGAFERISSYTEWNGCYLRSWLNIDFYEEAFNNEERKHILDSRLSTATAFRMEDNDIGAALMEAFKENNVDIYKDLKLEGIITDKVFIFSLEEAKTYFTCDAERAIGKSWWLQTEGEFGKREDTLYYVNDNGAIVGNNSGLFDAPKHKNASLGVRAAILYSPKPNAGVKGAIIRDKTDALIRKNIS